ncbi:HelD family protein [Allorhizocola rhizosphaerae]|uniref:HelD family protein n=1 Tax=Allorhizocola rhizosphaerae TaxID=1872709 RepID=UPI0014789F4E|nr:AAA family ATPase [Allorhizocola rhizosphaerae]
MTRWEVTVPASDLEDDPLELERAHLKTSRDALKAMRERAEAMFAVGDRVAGDAYTAEQLGRQMVQRIKELADNPDTPLFFGKLTMDSHERFHIGRRHVTDAAGEPLVLDWRAGLSRRFYQASARDPQGVAVRRRFGFAKGELTGFEDEHLDRGEELGTASAILTAEIERPRVGPMRDIVATIQPDQDVLVRADLDETICVQGAPGTGKTAVGLHRAAYLLYEYRERLRRSGVLIVGPNRTFLRYIGDVLPALGEIEVEQSTMDDLLDRVPVKGVDPPGVAALKHDPRIAEALHAALWGRIGEPTAPIVVPDGSYRWRIDEGVLKRLIRSVREEGPAYAVGRERLRARVVGLLQRQAESRRAESPSDAWLRRMGKAKPVTEFLDSCWPAVKPEQVVAAFLAEPPDGFELLKRATTRWTAADAVLVDEVAGMMDRMPSFGHIVIDEAQDLSPMQARALARRSTHGSLTVLGDLAQGTTPWAARDWRDVLADLDKESGQVVPLSTGFRVPEKVIELANRLLARLDVEVPPATSLRADGSLEIRESGDVAGAVAGLLAREGSIGVIVADASVSSVRALAPEDQRVDVVPVTLVKGLEYDHVLVVEPADIVEAEERGLHRLYVALTRAVTSLTVLHTKPLPEAFATTMAV